MIPLAMPFERWAEAYDALYAARGKDYRRESAMIAELAQRHDVIGGGLLDVACGTGEHLHHLQSSFELVTGIDACPAMLAVARDKLPAADLYEADMRRFDLGRRFDLVICLFASVGYLPDIAGLRQAIARMADHVAPRGLLMLEPALTPKQVRPPRTDRMSVEIDGTRVHRTTAATLEDNALLIRFDFEYERAANSEAFAEVHRIALFAPATYTEALEDAGLRIEQQPDDNACHVYLARRASR